MPTFLSDPSLVLYALLGVAFIISLAVWSRRRDRKSLLAVGGAGLLLLGLFLLDRAFESPREEANRRIETLAAAATAVNPDLFVEQLSPSFKHNGADRERVRTAGFWNLIRQHNARVAVWGFGKGEFEEIGDNEIEIGFYVKGEAAGFQGALIRRAKARFVRDRDSAWRAKGIKFFSVEENREEPVPGFP
jgi:hypothetical protein